MTSAAQAQQADGYAQLTFDGISVLLARESVVRIEAIADLDVNQRFGAHLMLGREQFRSPGVTLSKRLLPIIDTPASHRFVAFVNLQGKTLGVTAETIRLLPAQRVVVEALPECLRLPHSPVVGINRSEGEFTLVCDPEALVRVCVEEQLLDAA